MKLFVNHFMTLATAGCLLVFPACNDGPEKSKENSEPGEIAIDDVGGSGVGSSLMKLDHEIFSLPSPVQTAILLKKNAVDYDEDLVNPVTASKRYINRIQKALNMGVYGADLAYLSNFNNNQLKLDYFKVVDQMVSELDIRNHIDQSLIDRFAENIDVRDSLYALNAELFNAADRYLKQNDANEVAALILTGGWVEAMHLTMGSAMAHEDIRNRVGEQANAARSLAKLIKNMADPQLDQLVEQLNSVNEAFSDLGVTYEYVKPITDPSEKVTYINSKSKVEMSDEQLKRISNEITVLRNYIIQ